MDTALATPVTNLMQSDPAQEAANLKNKNAVHEAATKFEAMYLNEMFSHMFSGLKTDGPFSGGHGEEIFRSMMVDEFAKLTAQSGQTKIAPVLERAMLQMQEQQMNPRGPVTAPAN